MSPKSRLLSFTLLLLGALQGRSAGESHPAWIEVRSPHFIVVTNANEHQGHRTTYQFEMIRVVFRDFFGLPGKSLEQPVTIVAAKDEKTLKSLLPEHFANNDPKRLAGLYLNTGDTGANYIALRLDLSLNQEAYEPYEPVYHEYVHYLTRRMIAHWPLWVVEGFAEFYGNTRIENNKVTVGAPSASHILLLRESRLLSLNTLFDVNYSSPYYNEQSKASIFYAESWALMHYLRIRDSNEKSHRLKDFLDLLAKGVDQEQAATQTIGDLRSLEKALRAYIKNSEFHVASAAPPKIDESAFQVHGLSDAASLAVRADFMAHDRHYSEAQSMLEEALKLDPKLAAACESMSFISLQQGKQDEAGKWARQAVEENPQGYWGNYYYAWSLLRSRQDEESVAKAQASLRTVVKINPAFGPAYDTLAYALTLPGSHQDLKEAYSMTLWAVECEPGNIQYRIRAVAVLEQMGQAENAVRVATLATKMARTPEEQSTASQALENARQFQTFKQNNNQESPQSPTSETLQANTLAKPGANGNPIGPGVPFTASAEITVLSDANGFDFGPYLSQEVLPTLQKAWANLSLSDVEPAVIRKKTKTVIEFAIQKNGSLDAMNLKESSSSTSLDTAVINSFKAVTPFHALPAQFKGKSLALRLDLSFNPGSGTE